MSDPSCKRANKIRKKLLALCHLAQPKDYTDPHQLYQLGDKVICRQLKSAPNIAAGRTVLQDLMSVRDSDIDNLLATLRMRTKYLLLDREALNRELKLLRREVYRYRKALGEE